MLIKTSLVLLALVFTSMATRHYTLKEFDKFLFKSKRCGDFSVNKRLFLSKLLNAVLLVLFAVLLFDKGVI